MTHWTNAPVREVMMAGSPHRKKVKDWDPISTHGYSLLRGPCIPKQITNCEVRDAKRERKGGAR